MPKNSRLHDRSGLEDTLYRQFIQYSMLIKVGSEHNFLSIGVSIPVPLTSRVSPTDPLFISRVPAKAHPVEFLFENKELY